MSAYLERLIRLYNRLRRGPVTIEIISKWAKGAGITVSDRQLYRDLNQLKALEIAPGENVVEYTDEKNRKTWKLEYSQPSGKLTHYDINSFFLLKNFAPYAVLEERRASIEKFEKILYKSFSQNKYEQYIQGNELYLKKTNYNENLYGAVEHQQMEDLIWALHNSRTIVIESDLINPANIDLTANAFPLTMMPMELVFHRGRTHISGLSKEGRLLIFAIDKDFQFKLTNERFSRSKKLAAYKKSFDALYGISAPIDNKIHTIKLEFTKGYAESMKSFHWHPSQKWRALKNGNYMLELKCSIGRELVGFIAIGLDKIKVHQPKALKYLIEKKYEQSFLVNKNDLPINEEVANQDY